MIELAAEWRVLANLTRGQPFVVERVRLAGSGVAIEGASSSHHKLAQLNVQNQG